jgi:hypothetical protein
MRIKTKVSKRSWIISIVILITIFAVLFLLLYYSGGPNPEVGVGTARSDACRLLINNCNVSTDSILVENFDVNNDGKIDNSDTLSQLCKKYYGCPDEACCK